MDLGHYERFTGIMAKKNDNITTGKIYSEVLKKKEKVIIWDQLFKLFLMLLMKLKFYKKTCRMKIFNL